MEEDLQKKLGDTDNVEWTSTEGGKYSSDIVPSTIVWRSKFESK